jgi:hypothetical protein
MAKDLLDRFFRDAEGKTNRQIDVYFTLEDMGIQRYKAEESLEYLTSRGLINMFGPDIAFLTDLGVVASSQEKDIAKMPKAVRDFGSAKPPASTSSSSSREAPPAPSNSQKVARSPTPIPALPRSDMPRLSYVDPDGIQHVIELGWTCSIGRVEGNTIHLPDQRASKRHAELRFANGKYIVHDLGAANGTLVNGNYIDEHVLEHGDQILIGRTTLTYTSPLAIRPPAGPPPGDDEAAPVAPSASRPDAIPTPLTATERPHAQSIKVVKGRPDSRTAQAKPAFEVRREELPDLFEDARPDIPPFPPPSESDLFAETARGDRRPKARDQQAEDLFEASAEHANEEEDLFADSSARDSRDDDLFSDHRVSVHREPVPLPEEPDAVPMQPIDPMEPIYPIDPLAPLDEGPHIEPPLEDEDSYGATMISSKHRETAATPIDLLDADPDASTTADEDAPDDGWSEDRTPPDPKLLANQPVVEAKTEPPIPREMLPPKMKKDLELPQEEAATLMVSRDDIFPDGVPEMARRATDSAKADALPEEEPDTNVELENQPGFPTAIPEVQDPSMASTDDVLGAGEELHRWGEDPVKLGSHPSFASSRPRAPSAASLKGEEIPDAPLGLPDLSVSNFPALSPDGMREKKPRASSSGRPDSHFHKLIQYLRNHVERADLPDKDALLAALDLLDRHPYIRVALNLSDSDRAKY